MQDLISRQAAIDAVVAWTVELFMGRKVGRKNERNRMRMAFVFGRIYLM